MINVSELINDPDFTQPNGVDIVRRKCEVENHLQKTTEEKFNVRAIVTISDEAKKEMLDYADRIEEAIHVFTYKPLYTTGKISEEPNSDGYLSDIVIWKGIQYTVMSCLDYEMQGYCRSTAVKMAQEVI